MKKGEILEGTGIRCDFPDSTVVLTDENEEAAVRFCLPGQRVSFRVTKKKGGVVHGTLLEILERSPSEHNNETCAHFGTCGGCFCQSLDYADQLELKEGQMRRLTARLCEPGLEGENAPEGQGGVPADDAFLFEGIAASPEIYGYRNKMELTFGDEFKDGPLALGLHRRGSFYDIVTVRDCRIMHPDMKMAAACVLEHFGGLGIPYYHRMRHTGVLRHLLLRRSRATGELLAALVTADDGRDISELKLELLSEKLRNLPLQGSLAGFLHMKNNAVADLVRSEETSLLFGRDSITEKLLDLQFRISPFSFFQTNSAGAEVLYGIVREYAGGNERRLIYDLYSGTGTIAQILAPIARKVVGVEIVGEAVEAARRNARENGLENCEFLEGDVLKCLDEMTETPDLIILDPPRDGIHPKALPKILSYGVARIVYVSCKPTSFVRDYPAFTAAGYRAVRAKAVDMFPGTAGTELVVCLEKDAGRP